MPAHKLSTDLERFLSFVDRDKSRYGCWEWMKPLTARGYGQMSTGSRAAGTFRNRGAHVFALESALGRPLLDGMGACHICDNPACVRNDDHGWYEVNGAIRIRRGHLFEGTTQDNTADRHEKGRSCGGDKNGAHLHPETIERGSQRYNAAFTEDEVRAVRARAGLGERLAVIAREFKVAPGTIGHIVYYRSWKHVV
jgi:hypothetical protein